MIETFGRIYLYASIRPVRTIFRFNCFEVGSGTNNRTVLIFLERRAIVRISTLVESRQLAGILEHRVPFGKSDWAAVTLNRTPERPGEYQARVTVNFSANLLDQVGAWNLVLKKKIEALVVSFDGEKPPTGDVQSQHLHPSLCSRVTGEIFDLCSPKRRMSGYEFQQ